jgi:phosphoglycerate dehydrogenase-like enzyme
MRGCSPPRSSRPDDALLAERLKAWRAAQTDERGDRPRMTALLPPGSTIGILGGGQLGRMLAVAAAQLGYRTHVLAPDAESVAAQTASSYTRADYHSRIVLDELAAQPMS